MAAFQRHRIVGRDLVKIIPIRQASIFQHELPPAALTENPFALFRHFHAFGNRLFYIVDRSNFSQVNHCRQVDPHGCHMAMGIIEPGKHRLASKVHHHRIRACALENRTFRSHLHELPILDCSGFSNGEILVNRDDFPIVNN